MIRCHNLYATQISETVAVSVKSVDNDEYKKARYTRHKTKRTGDRRDCIQLKEKQRGKMNEKVTLKPAAISRDGETQMVSGTTKACEFACFVKK